MATKYCILYWQEIPSFVEATDGETKQKIQLSDRFQELIDKAAMRRKLAGTDAYLEGFNKGEPAHPLIPVLGSLTPDPPVI